MYDTREPQLLQEALIRYDALVNRPYLHDLSCLSIVSPAPYSLPITLLQLKPIPASTSPKSFAYILNALNGMKQVIGYILFSSPDGISVYIGIKGQNCSSVSLQLLKAGIKQTFPNVEISLVNDASTFLAKLFNKENATMLSTATGIPYNDSPSFMNTFTSIMGKSTSYACFFLAHPVPPCDLKQYYDELCDIYEQLSTFNQASHNNSSNLAKNSSVTLTKCNTSSSGTSNNLTTGESHSCNTGSYTNLSGSTPLAYCENKTVNATLLQNRAFATVDQNNSSVANGTSKSHSLANTQSNLSATNKTDNQAITFIVQNTLEHTNTLISRLQTLLRRPCFAFNAYFLSNVSEASLRAAYNFQGMCQSADNQLVVSSVNFWDQSHPSFAPMLNALQHFEAPVFSKNSSIYTSSIFIHSNELLNCFYI